MVFHTSGNGGDIRSEERDSLRLHVGAHQSSVGVVMLKKGDQSSADTNNLVGSHIHIVDTLARRKVEFGVVPSGDASAHKFVTLIQWGVSLGNDESILDIG